jgi:S1-C subfamily serine protease
MAEHFLSKIRVASEDFVEADGTPVLERHADLHALLATRAGPEVAALFAEPLISRGNDAAPPTVSWYGDVDGEAHPLASLPANEQARAETYLVEHLRPLRVLTEDPANADLALGALTTYGREDVLVQNGVPVIVNWGLMPDGKGANAAARPAHYAATLGKFLPLSQGSPGDPSEGMVAGPGTPTPRSAPILGQNASASPPTDTRRRTGISPIAWVPLLVLLVIAGLVLAWLLSPGTRLFHAADPAPLVTDAETLKAAQALNQSLRDRRAVLETALEGAVCRADGILLLPDGRTPEGLLPPALGVEPALKAQADPNALLQSSPNRVLVPDPDQTDADGADPQQITLLQLIETRTVLIMVSTPTGVTTGSGFVVGPGLIVTNHHVIEPALGQPGQILVTGAALDQPHLATVVKTQGPMTKTGGDFALLRIEATSLPAFVVHRSSTSLKLTNVIAAGYPGDVLELDIDFAALKAGDLTAVPGLTVTDGTVNTEQQIGPDTHVLMHSAPLSSGNSGGPLVDMCGRLVGVNTFTRQGVMQNRGFALTAGDLLAFLEGTAANPLVVSDACAPVVARAQANPSSDPKPDPAPDQPAKD